MFSSLKTPLPFAIVGWSSARDALSEASVDRLRLAADARVSLLQTTAERIRLDLENLAANPLVGASLGALGKSLSSNPAEFEKTKATFAAGDAGTRPGRDGADAGTRPTPASRQRDHSSRPTAT